jgi:glycolate oxidase FAD binding subunit
LPSVSSAAEAAEAFAAAGREGRRLRIGEDLTTEGLDRLLEHEAGDLTCTAEAGMRLRELNERLAQHGQRLTLDPPGNPTIGACIASDLSGPRRHRFGRVGDLLLGVTVVLGDGLVASSGGKVVKNVAGYDLGKLFCGSEGRLGLIARAAFRLHPLPEVERSLVVPAADAEAALGLLREVVRSQLVPSAVDLLWPGKLCLLFEGGGRAVAAQLAAAQSLLGGDEGDPWPEVRAFQARCRSRVRFEHLDGEQLVRAGEAYLPEGRPRVWSPLAERIRAQLDPYAVLV